MEKIVLQSLLYDFYGELLKPNQKAVFEEYVLDNYSLSEIAEERGISRQGVHDMIKRTDKLLCEYEDKLHLVKRFLDLKEKVNRIDMLVSGIKDNDSIVNEVRLLTDEIINEL